MARSYRPYALAAKICKVGGALGKTFEETYQVARVLFFEAIKVEAINAGREAYRVALSQGFSQTDAEKVGQDAAMECIDDYEAAAKGDFSKVEGLAESLAEAQAKLAEIETSDTAAVDQLLAEADAAYRAAHPELPKLYGKNP